MITGFNTDIDHDGRVFHVQTEDKGVGLRLVETLIYCRGEIVTAQRSSYEGLATDGEPAEKEVLGRMETQHKQMIRDIRNGKFDAELPKPFGYNIVSNHTLDEVVIRFLMTQSEDQPIKLEFLDEQTLHEGTRPTVRLKVLDARTSQPLAGARVVVTLATIGGTPVKLFSSDAAADGFIEASFEIPTLLPTCKEPEIVCAAEADGRRVEVRRELERATNGSAQPA